MRCSDQKIAVTSLVLLGIWIFVVLPLMYFPWKPSDPSTFWGLDSTAWTAIGALSNAVYCVLTVGLLVFAIYQILSAKKDAKITRTLAACERYDLDPVLDQITRRLSIARKSGALKADPSQYSVDLTSMFNYFESLAIGVARGHYDAEIVRDQFERIFDTDIEDMKEIGNWSTGPSDQKDIDDFDKMIALNEKWKNSRA